jgi:hypothetical protein
MSAFPCVCGVWPFIWLTPQTVVLEVIDKFDKEDGNSCLGNEGQENGRAVSIESDQEATFE